RNDDRISERSSLHAKVPGPVVCLHLDHQFLRCLSYGTHHRAGRKLPGCLSCRRHSRIHGLWPGPSEQWHLEESTLEHRTQRGFRRTDLWSVDCRNFWLALAALAPAVQIPEVATPCFWEYSPPASLPPLSSFLPPFWQGSFAGDRRCPPEEVAI